MRMRLKKIKLENFKGQKSFEYFPDGKDVSISAENGVGKTTAGPDAFFWLHYDKDSSGRTAFAVRPLDKDNQTIKGCVVAVEDELVIDGQAHTFRKEYHERIVKDQLKGYTNKYFIDEVPQKEKEFKEYHDNLCPESIFKMLTDINYFNQKLPQQERRKVLVDCAGNLPKPAGFEDLQAKQNGRTLEQYEGVLKSHLKKYKEERDEINPRIDELQRSLDDYAQNQDDEADLQAKRDTAVEKLNDVIARQKALLESEKERLKKREKINDLQGEQQHRANVLKNQQGPVDDLIDERNKLESEHGERTQEIVKIQRLIQQANAAIESAQNQIESSQLTLKDIRKEYEQSDSPNCSLCGQKWPEDKPKPGLADIEARGNRVKAKIEEVKAHKNELQESLNELLAEEKAKVEELKKAEAIKNKRIAEINEQIKTKPTVDPELDEEWKSYQVEIEQLKSELGEPATVQLNLLESERGLAETCVNELNKCLAQVDTIKKTRDRIVELENKEKDLAQKIANVEKELDEIQQYKLAESKMIEASVNGMFKHITWKLFKYNLNGSIDDICEALYNGTPYSDLSAGEKIYCGIDVINTLSDYYGVEVPLFVDHAESMTLPIEAESQVIKLYAQQGVKELVVEVEQEAGKAVA